MLVIPGAGGANDCDRVTRRDLLRVGGSGVLGISLAQMFALEKASAKADVKGEAGHGPGFGKAKSVIFIYLQGGPSHLDLWDPKDNVPDKVKSIFKHQTRSCLACTSPNCCRSSRRSSTRPRSFAR